MSTVVSSEYQLRLAALEAELQLLRARRSRLERELAQIDRELKREARRRREQRRGNRPLDYYEQVHVEGATGELASLNGTTGVVMGRDKNSKGKWGYVVRVDKDHTCWDLPAKVLVPTGIVLSREQFYSGGSVRVAVDERGRSTVVRPPAAP